MTARETQVALEGSCPLAGSQKVQVATVLFVSKSRLGLQDFNDA
jgi:hypothetical protein